MNEVLDSVLSSGCSGLCDFTGKESSSPDLAKILNPQLRANIEDDYYGFKCEISKVTLLDPDKISPAAASSSRQESIKRQPHLSGAAFYHTCKCDDLRLSVRL
jgi:hypothetical protein